MKKSKSLENFKLTPDKAQTILGGNGGKKCKSYRRTYVGDEWWQDDVIMDDCTTQELERNY